MAENVFEQSQAQATKFMDSLVQISRSHLQTLREETERGFRQGLAGVEFLQEATRRQAEQGWRLSQAVIELQQDLLHGLWQTLPGALQAKG